LDRDLVACPTGRCSWRITTSRCRFHCWLVMAELTVAVTVGMRLPYSSPSNCRVVCLCRWSSWWMWTKSGRGRTEARCAFGSEGNNAASNSGSDISAGSGQAKPAAANRRKYSCTVLWLRFVLRAIWRCPASPRSVDEGPRVFYTWALFLRAPPHPLRGKLTHWPCPASPRTSLQPFRDSDHRSGHARSSIGFAPEWWITFAPEH
jgi:hypothetical protein